MLNLLSHIIVVDAALEQCKCCFKVKPLAALAPLDSDYTADQAAPSYSLEREDLLCKDCREALEAEYGTEAPQSFKHWSYLGR